MEKSDWQHRYNGQNQSSDPVVSCAASSNDQSAVTGNAVTLV